MGRILELPSRSPDQTLEIGRVLGEALCGGEIIELCGPLGAGKTQLAKGLALGLGVPKDEPIVSPTFVLVREYQGRLKFYHCDAYRLWTVEELLALGLEELLEEPGAVVAIEWADRFADALAGNKLRVDLEYGPGTCRRVRISGPSSAWERQLVRRLRTAGVHADAGR